MASNKQQYEKFTTPKGVAHYPHLVTPDTYKGQTKYKVGLILEEKEAKALIKKIDKATEVAKSLVPKIKFKEAEEDGREVGTFSPYKAERDDELNKTGRYIFSFSMNASYKNSKTGEVVELKPKLFDAAGKPIKKIDSIWGGSVMAIAGEFFPCYVASTEKYGVSLRLNAVQIIELNSGGGGDGASFGFEATDGYEVEQEDTATDAGFGDDEEDEDF